MTAQEAQKRLEALCSRSEHCTFEMQEKMRRWGIDEKSQAEVMAALIKGRYIDDERFARAFAADKVRYNKWGKRKVDMALCQKRIPEDIRRIVIDEIDDDALRDTLRPLLQAKMKSTKAKNDYDLSCKLIRFALGRGFGIEETRECLSDLFSQCDIDLD